MKKLTKKQEWGIVIAVCIVIALVVGVTYYLLTLDSVTMNTTQETNTEVQEGQELKEIESDLESLDDLDFSELDAIEKDLNSTDLSEL